MYVQVILVVRYAIRCAVNLGKLDGEDDKEQSVGVILMNVLGFR